MMDITQVTELANSQFHTWLSAQMSNDFLIAGMGTVLLSGVLYTLKSLPGRIWNALYHRSTITVNVFSDNEYFRGIATELSENTINFLSRQNVLDGDNLGIGLGTSWSRFRGSLVKISRTKEDSDSAAFKQDLQLTFFFTRKAKIVSIFKSFVKDKTESGKDKIRIYSFSGSKDYLQFMKEIPKRDKSSIFVPQDILDHIEKRLKFFLENKDWYEKHGIPYKYSILLHGVPGTGKTTLAKYIAGITNRYVVMVSPTKLPALAVTLQSRWDYDAGKVIERKFLGILEDIDADNITAKRKTDEDDEEDGSFSLITLADLLNAIDGINSPEDFILVATTNHLSKLDPALFRKGRFDDVIEVKPLDTPEIIRMVETFFETGSDSFLASYEPIPGAVLQDIILTHFDEGIEKVVQVLNEK